MPQKLINEIGNRYGSLVVLSASKDKNGRTAWLCQCDCGKTKIVRGSDLRGGRITSCGAGCPTKRDLKEEEIGKRYGRLIVLYRNGSNSSQKILLHCKCDCGEEVDIAIQHLHNGNTRSCGCYNNEERSARQFKDEIGNKYGKLTVLSLVSKSPKAIWRCKCDCGKIVEKTGIALRSGSVKSCGCLLSWPEEEIASILNKNKIIYQRQVTFDDLRTDKKEKLRFDFGIYNKEKLLYLIEYQGEQHYKPIEFYGGNNYFFQLQYHDKMKQEYCIMNNIPLLILNKKDNLEEKILNFSSVWEELE